MRIMMNVFKATSIALTTWTVTGMVTTAPMPKPWSPKALPLSYWLRRTPRTHQVVQHARRSKWTPLGDAGRGAGRREMTRDNTGLPPIPWDSVVATGGARPVEVSDMLCRNSAQTIDLYTSLTQSPLKDSFVLYGILPTDDGPSSSPPTRPAGIYHEHIYFKTVDPVNWVSRQRHCVMESSNERKAQWFIFQHCIDQINPLEESVMVAMWNDIVMHQGEIALSFCISKFDTRSCDRIIQLTKKLNEYKETESPWILEGESTNVTRHVWMPSFFYDEGGERLWVSLRPHAI